MGSLSLEMHVHTCFSHDSMLSLQSLADDCMRKNINCIAITDHNAIEGAILFKKAYPRIQTIIGEEILTEEGELIAYFIDQFIPPGLSVEETIRRIKEQGGLVCVPHPFDQLRGKALKYNALENYLDDIDIIESFNARNRCAISNQKAFEFARTYSKLESIGNDAHTAYEIGRCSMVIAEFNSVEEFRQSLKSAKISTKSLSFFRDTIYSCGARMKKMVMGRICDKCNLCR